jgi:hypothetical protein
MRVDFEAISVLLVLYRHLPQARSTLTPALHASPQLSQIFFVILVLYSMLCTTFTAHLDVGGVPVVIFYFLLSFACSGRDRPSAAHHCPFVTTPAYNISQCVTGFRNRRLTDGLQMAQNTFSVIRRIS